jgi:hypothetical protein
LLIIRAFHLSWKVLSYLFCFFYFLFPAKKKNLCFKSCWKSFRLLHNTFQEMLTYRPAWMNFDPLQSYWSLHRNPYYQSISKTAMHENFCILTPFKTSWKHCSFVMSVRWSLRELLPLKLYNFYVFVVERQNQLEYDKWHLTLKIGPGQSSRSSEFYENKTFFIFPSLHETLKR